MMDFARDVVGGKEIGKKRMKKGMDRCARN